jgi:hypothetical protein
LALHTHIYAGSGDKIGQLLRFLHVPACIRAWIRSLDQHAHISKERPMKTVPKPALTRRQERVITFAIPAVSFGGIAVAVVLLQSGVIADAGTFVWGCVAGAFLLGYLAYTKPRKDIVALCAPLYAVIIFIIPLEYTPTLLLQLLFAATITLLLFRLNRKFGSSAEVQGGSNPMERFLFDYIERIRPLFAGMDRRTAHEIASAFLSFKFGLYQNTIEECRLALAAIPDEGSAAVLKKALLIVQANAEGLKNAQVTAAADFSFTESEQAFAAITLPQEKIEDPESLNLDNALILLFAVARNTSEDDEQALDEHQKFVLKILSSYKSALGIV